MSLRRMRFDYAVMPDWPPLAWLAKLVPGDDVARIFHGPSVEAREGFFCEAVWAGAFEARTLGDTDIVAGSAAVLRDDGILFVSSGSTVDRLVASSASNATWVSNSLPCLLAATKATVDPTYGRYYADFYTVVEGLSRYKRSLATSAGEVQLCYFDNLAWDGARLSQVAKPSPPRDFSSFARYHQFLRDSMRALADNAASAERRIRYRLLGTISTGYDSPTVAALASEVGCDEAICFDQSHNGEPDSGESIGQQLGIRPLKVMDRAWRTLDRPEVPFAASNGMGEEVRFASAASLLGARVLLTGYHGDKMWDRFTKALSPDVVRGDPSGLGLSEYRLWAGFIHCPVPFWGVRQIAQVNAISNSPEMAPWDVGGDYTRPICRRIVEARGVGREMFGQRKRNASVMLHNYDDFLSDSSWRDFSEWLRARRGEWTRRGRVPPIASRRLDRLVHDANEALVGTFRNLPGAWRLAAAREGQPTYLRRWLFPWAVERACARYTMRDVH